VQEDLVLAVAATGTPTVVTLVSGRPYALHVLRERVPAIVQAWLPGEEGGPALAGVLFGRVNPAGRSPVTFGRGAGQQPLSYLHKSLGRTGYARSSTRPVFAFGHGLSYTTFSYGDLELSGSELALDGTLTVSCSLTNTGRRSGSEVAQLYIHDPFASATRPVQELKGYARIDLDPGRSARVTFELPADLLSFTGLDLRRIVEPGRIDLMIGASSADIRLRASVELVGDGPRLVGPGRALTTAVTVSG
jgi:beta-glucosidase